MTAMIRETEPYLAHLAELEQRVAGRRSPALPLLPLRRQAMARFAELGFPTTRNEEWKYTNVAPIARTVFRPAPSDARGIAEGQVPFARIAACRLVFVNGWFAPGLSALEQVPRGVAVCSLTQARDARLGALLDQEIARYARFESQPFVALNTALFEDGALVRIPRGSVVEEPIHLVFLATAGEESTVFHPRVLIVAEESSQATVIETYAGLEDGRSGERTPYWTNSVTEIVVAENAVLDHYRVQRESEAAFHIATQQVQQERNSNFSSHAISLGGALVRNDVNAVLSGEGIEATLNGLYVAHGEQHIDTHTAIDHAMPHCNSHELYKGILDDRATGVFNGKIFVRQDAQKTDAKQTNQNLLLSRDAVIDTKPQLEIFADDVRCTHGATVGQLDEDAIFYLRSRGIGAAEARGLLTYAFASDILSRIKVEALRHELEALLFARLPKSALTKEGREALDVGR